MSPPSTKICKLCGVGFRGTPTPEEVHCAKCFVKTCDVPEDTDEQFSKLVSEIHGPEVASVPKKPLPAGLLLPMMKDILKHKERLARLERDVEKSNKSTKEKNRTKREIFRLRKEKDEMEGMMEGIKAKMMHLALMTAVSHPGHVAPPTTPKGKSVTDSPLTTPKTPAMPRVPTNTPVTVTPSSIISKSSRCTSVFGNGETPPLLTITTPTVPKSPPRSPSKDTPQQKQPQQEQQPPMTPTTGKSTTASQQPQMTPTTGKSSTASPVKLTALKFEAAAKKVTNVVTFKMPSKLKSRDPEVNNNDMPVTASSSSEEEGDENEEGLGIGNSSALTRSNSVRDRIKAFEEIQRRASTGSYDRKRIHGRKRLSSMKSINV